MELRPKALITGATRGIGRAVAEALAQTHTIVLSGRDEELLQQLAERLPSAEVRAGDVLDDAVCEAIAADIPELDVLVHSAGIYTKGRIEACTRDEWRRGFEVNVFAAAELTRRLLPALRRGRGTVVFLNSGAGQFSYDRGAVYSGTKFALKTFADTLRIEERDNGIRVTSIHPGRVDTDLVRDLATQEGTTYDPSGYLSPKTIAEAVRAAVMAPPEASFDSITVRPAFPVHTA